VSVFRSLFTPFFFLRRELGARSLAPSHTHPHTTMADRNLETWVTDQLYTLVGKRGERRESVERRPERRIGLCGVASRARRHTRACRACDIWEATPL